MTTDDEIEQALMEAHVALDQARDVAPTPVSEMLQDVEADLEDVLQVYREHRDE
jgi:hypothetical protein